VNQAKKKVPSQLSCVSGHRGRKEKREEKSQHLDNKRKKGGKRDVPLMGERGED